MSTDAGTKDTLSTILASVKTTKQEKRNNEIHEKTKRKRLKNIEKRRKVLGYGKVD